jgi:hypothetical protein
VILLSKDEKILGMSLMLSEDTVLRFMFSGLDHLKNKEYAIYFNTLYAIINLAIQEKKSKIDMGITTLIPKMEVGSRIEPLTMFMHHPNGVVQWILCRLFTWMTPYKNLPTRKAFL